MKKKFSTSWTGSKQPRKQRKYRYNAPLHLRHKFLNAQLSKELKGKYGKSNLPLRTGDEVLVMRGKFAKKTAKIVSIDLKKTKVVLENINQTKKDGTKVNIHFHPSNLRIQSLQVEDNRRLKRIKIKESTSKTDKTKGEKKNGVSDKSGNK